MKLAVDIIPYTDEGRIAFIERKFPPFENMLALPGGFVENDETIRAAAIRELKEETGIEAAEGQLQIIGIYDAVDRDPRERVISVAFYLEVPDETEIKAGDDAKAVKFYTPEEAGKAFAFDHISILKDAMRIKLMEMGVPTNMASQLCAGISQ